MNSWVRQEVEAPYPQLTDDETNTENIIPWPVIQLTRRTAENRRVVITMRLQPSNTCLILLNTDLVFLFQRISISRPTLKVCLCHVIKQMQKISKEREFSNQSAQRVPLLTALDCFQNQVLPFIHSFIQKAGTDAQTPTPYHALCQELGIGTEHKGHALA